MQRVDDRLECCVYLSIIFEAFLMLGISEMEKEPIIPGFKTESKG